MSNKTISIPNTASPQASYGRVLTETAQPVGSPILPSRIPNLVSGVGLTMPLHSTHLRSKPDSTDSKNGSSS